MGRAASFVSELRRGWHTVRLETLKRMSHTPRMPHHHPCSPFVEHQRRSWGRSSAICVQVPRRRKTSSSRSAEVKLYFDKFESGHHETRELARGRGETRLVSCPGSNSHPQPCLALGPTHASSCASSDGSDGPALPAPHMLPLPQWLSSCAWSTPWQVRTTGSSSVASSWATSRGFERRRRFLRVRGRAVEMEIDELLSTLNGCR